MTLIEYNTAMRNFIKDKEPLNRLLKFFLENEEEDLDIYINMALGFLQYVPPFLGIPTIEEFPMPALLIHQATIECLISNSIVQARNDLTYNNGGVTVKVSDGERYLRLLQQLYRMTDLEISAYKNLKIAQNIAAGWGGVYSPYSRIHGTQQSLLPNSIF